MAHRVVFIQGGGIGYDQESSVKRVIEAAGVAIEWQDFRAGRAALDANLEPIPADLLDAIRETGVAMKLKLLPPRANEEVNFNVQLRRALGLFASVRPIRNVLGLPSRFDGIDILLVREITEDLYNAGEHEIIPGVVQSLKIVTETACLRIFRFAFELARKHNRKSIHCIHKANILKLADGLFLDCFRRVATEFPEIEAKDMIVDNGCMQLVSRPSQFDVIVAGNLYGDILSDLGAGLVGGISTTAGVNHGDGVRVYEAIHGATRGNLGEDRANPLPALLPAIELVRDLGETHAADRIINAIGTVLTEGNVKTPDLGGDAGTRKMTDAIIAALST